MGKLNKLVNKVLNELNKDKDLVDVKYLECKREYRRDGELIFKEGKKYEVVGLYGKNFVVITEQGNGHSVTNGENFMKEYFKKI